MSVKTYFGSGSYDPSVLPRVPLPAEETQGHVHALVSTKELINGDSINSVVYFGKVASNARLIANSRLDHDALTSLTDFDLGIGRWSGGAFTLQDIDCLLDGADVSSAGSKSFSGIDIANLRKPLWEVAGYSDDPGGELEIVGTLKAASGAAGTLTLTALFATP